LGAEEDGDGTSAPKEFGGKKRKWELTRCILLFPETGREKRGKKKQDC